MSEIGHYAVDEDLLEHVRAGGKSQVRVVRPASRAIVLGRSSKPELEVKLEAASRDGIPVLRRRGGGCAVLLDPGNLVISVVLPIPGLSAIDTWFGRISRWLSHEFEEAGIPGVGQGGVSDLILGEQKIGGSCIFRSRGLLYYSTTLLVEADVDLIERYLAHPPREPDYRAGRRHRDFLGRIADFRPGVTTATLKSRLEPLLNAERLTAFSERSPLER